MKTRRTWRNAPKKSQESGQRAAGVARALGSPPGAFRGRWAWVAGSVAVLVAGLVGTWLWLGGEEESTPPDPRARQYKDFNACLLTDDKGITSGTTAATVWEGMQEASGDTRVRVTYVPVTGEQTAGNALPFMNGLLQRKCSVVLAVGEAQVKAAEQRADDHKDIRFVTVDGTKKGANITAAPSGDGDGLKNTVADTIRGVVEASGV
ncbi:BMP family ABC transporter substrate-binding protein [Streptomyces sp. HNM0663]|uniref:BMP family ABC transporter substrate-binding protein n=1 Tax=Streptomyces chengmaiensis TaxID=3040919 RepID=A0ABT6HY29_9ACTN|nr:BMP family ABC transporter substrate-binding protein [Streptomyces chengmaiensis]MDH2393310.1 BMP family ABC transporter substrate-binding protein [Streptomyces chengmaiensis]